MTFKNNRGLPKRSIGLLVLLSASFTVLAQQGWNASKVSYATGDLNTVFFLDSKRGWVGGDKGFLGRTDDGGRTWRKRFLFQPNIGKANVLSNSFLRIS